MVYNGDALMITDKDQMCEFFKQQRSIIYYFFQNLDQNYINDNHMDQNFNLLYI